ncbi:PAS domain S-box protein [Mariprofundus sp. NF]|uniref:PAS domain-containing hybrid sensor histidine kinase/response regulator n=1 Tax=Mariprofundus sp. NF TaxID=2608716 RepID=UPI0015A394A7|nr:PAS domain S-box protein [Mariprofundus sp. NF]NWF39794.1 PAS domain S-box protein [Mariprofundus sp. NF]
MKDSAVEREQDAISSGLLKAEQTALAYGSISISLAANLVNSTILAVLLWPVADHTTITCWWLFSTAISLLRGFHAWQYRKACPSVDEAEVWLNRFRLGMYLAALSWGVATALLFVSDSVAYQSLLAFFVAGMTAGAITTLSQLWRTLLAYLYLPIVPLIINLSMEATTISWTMAVIIALYLLMMTGVARRAHDTTLQNIRLRIDSGLHEQALEKSERKFRLLYESVADAIFILDLKGNFIDVNRSAYERLGYSKEELLAKHISDLDTPRYAVRVPERMALLMSQGSATFEAEHLHKNGDVMPVEVSARLVDIHEERAIFSVVRDLSERNQTKKELMQSEERFRDISMSMADWIWEVDAEGRYTFVSGKVKELLGYEPEEVLGKTPFELMSEEEAARVASSFQTIIANRAPIINLENWNRTKDGRDICMLTNGVPILDERGALTGYRGVDQDITERRRSEDQLRKLSRAIEYAGESILITDLNGVIEYANPAFSQMTGYSVDEAIGEKPSMLKSGEQDDAFYQTLWGTITSGRAWQGSLVDRRKDGSFYSTMMTVAPIMDEAGEITHFVAMQRDVSEYEELEARFQQAQKMEAIGTLVGGIAHDFNNMLAALLGNLYLAKNAAKDDPDMIARLNRVESVSQRAAEMIAQLLTFARKGKVKMVPLPLAPFLEEMFKLARPSIPENIDMQLDIADHELLALGDETQLQQVLLNLITNASHALEGCAKPNITFGVKAYHPDTRFTQVHADVDAEQMALLYVTDNGCGISEANLDKVFEPFFTTKEAGKGSGLGLSMVHGAIKSHGGAIEVESARYSGTTVKIYIPLQQPDEAKPVADMALMEPEKQGAGEGILLVDDEALVREVNAEVLQEMGYRLFTAEDGIDAQQVYAAHRSEIGLAVLDLVMPRMGGMELLQWLREQDSELPVILMTGYDREQVLPAKSTPQKCIVLNKPVDITKMSRAVHAMLEGE